MECLWTGMATAQLVEIVLDPNYKPLAGEEQLCCQQLTYIYKVLLETVLERKLRAILHGGDVTRSTWPHILMHMFCPYVISTPLLFTWRVAKQLNKQYCSCHTNGPSSSSGVCQTRSGQIHTYMFCLYVISTASFTVFLKSHKCELPKEYFSHAFFSQLYM
jgi:hypothetical protein